MRNRSIACVPRHNSQYEVEETPFVRCCNPTGREFSRRDAYSWDCLGSDDPRARGDTASVGRMELHVPREPRADLQAVRRGRIEPLEREIHRQSLARLPDDPAEIAPRDALGAG